MWSLLVYASNMIRNAPKSTQAIAPKIEMTKVTLFGIAMYKKVAANTMMQTIISLDLNIHDV